MWKPPLTFLNLHYAYIIGFALLGFILIVPEGNVPAVDALFFGASGCTESGLNTVDVKDLKVYQQLVIYFIPFVTNLCFINILVIVVRLYWFQKKLNESSSRRIVDPERFDSVHHEEDDGKPVNHDQSALELGSYSDVTPDTQLSRVGDQAIEPQPKPKEARPPRKESAITFAPDSREREASDVAALYIPGPRERDQGLEPREVGDVQGSSSAVVKNDPTSGEDNEIDLEPRRVKSHRRSLSLVRSRLGKSTVEQLPRLSSQVTVGRNSSFHKLTAHDREILGGTEYLALKLLLKITLGYFFGLHVLGVIGLLPWIHRAPSAYTDYIQEVGQDKTWWAFYSAATMVNNLGFTLTPDSMVSFRDATWPMLLMIFLAFAGNTFYPIFLRLVIWLMSKVTKETAAIQQPLQFLLNHPRRCYTLLFPSRPTWILCGILVALNVLDTMFIIVLDLDNEEVNALPLGPRILAALFQAASARHTGTSTFNLANVNPAVQLSLLAMMYIAVFPIAISVRASNTYEERALGVYVQDELYDENNGRSYFLTHIRRQLSFDLWYIFIGVFCIIIAESGKIMDQEEPAFNVFAILFEVTSAYGNVGLSLGHPDVATSLAGQLSSFSKVVICAMMIRGRHRMLPSNIDRAIMLPGDSRDDA